MNINIKKVKGICKLFYGASNLPIYIYEKETSIGAFSAEPSVLPILPCGFSLMEQNPCILDSSFHGFWGIIRLSDEISIMMGPAITISVTNDLIHDYMRENAISLDKKGQTANLLSALPMVSLSQMMNKIALLYYTLTGEFINPITHFKPYQSFESSNLKEKALRRSIDSKENLITHNTYSWEKELYHIIRSGDTAKLNAFFEDIDSISQLTEGKVATTPVRQAKNLFIGLVTKIGMLAAIPGGLDVEQTYQLIDVYEQECETLSDPEAIYKLNYVAAMDFCSRLSETKIPEGISTDVYLCMEYIKTHTNEPLSITDVARSIHRSNSYVIQHFKQELGINIGAYITRCKLEESKSLLTYSDKSLADISNFLCFSSQSYFQNVFKKKFGMTPLQYRKISRNSRERKLQ